MRFSPLPPAFSPGNLVWPRLQTVLLNLDQLHFLIREGQEQTLWQEWLHQTEQEKLQTLHYEKRHIEWLGGRICAKQAALQYLRHDHQGQQGTLSDQKAIAAPELLIMNSTAGRPFLAHQARPQNLDLPHISISHSKGYALAMAAASPCGIDIQAESPSLSRVKDHFCAAAEDTLLRQGLKQLPAKDQLTLLWVAKEAVKKSVSWARMPGFLELSLIRIQTIARDGLVPFAPKKSQLETDGLTSFLFTLAYYQRQDGNEQHSGHPPQHIQVAVGLHHRYGIGLSVIPSQPGAANA